MKREALSTKGKAPDTGKTTIEIDAATLARAIREQDALPIAADEAETLAHVLEASQDDEELLANTLAAIRLLVERLEVTP